MKVIEISPGQFKTYGTIPKIWKVDGVNWENFHLADPNFHYQVGFRDLIYPPYNSTTQKLGGFIWDGDNITYQVVDLPEEEVKEKIIQNERFEKEKLIKEKLDKMVEVQIQTITDDAEILANKKGYPIWETLPTDQEFKIGFIVKDFVGPDMELVVFRCNTLHTKDATKPELSTRWDEISVLDWVPGKSYMKGDEVKRNGKLYVSQIDNNTNDPANSSKDIWLEIKA